VKTARIVVLTPQEQTELQALVAARIADLAWASYGKAPDPRSITLKAILAKIDGGASASAKGGVRDGYESKQSQKTSGIRR
jgi:hypothetical protein